MKCSYSRFFIQLQKELKFFLFSILFLGLGRIVFFVYFRHEVIDDLAFTEIYKAIKTGFRFDAMVASYFLIPSLFLTLLSSLFNISNWAERVRRLTAGIFVVVTTISYLIGIGYYQQFHEPFNQVIFNLFTDDTKAIFLTIYHEHPVWLYLLFLSAFSFVVIWIQRKWIKDPFFKDKFLDKTPFPLLLRVCVTLLIVGGIVCGFRGSTSRWPMRRSLAWVCTENLLNNGIMNPYIAFRYAYVDHLNLQRSTGITLFLKDSDPVKAVQFLSASNKISSELDSYFLKKAQGVKSIKPKHIFFVLMESYDTWPMQEKYRDLQLCEGLKDIASRGLYVKKFLPASFPTIKSLETLLTGLPDAGVKSCFRPNSRSPYPTSLASQMKKLGYKTRFFYAGPLSWECVGEFSKNQGFDEVYGSANIKTHYKLSTGSEWGVYDEHLFNFAYDSIDDEEPSFNFIITISYHPPYFIDVYSKGYPVKEINNDEVYDGKVPLRIFGHLWYADQCLKGFVSKMESKVDLPLFAITGDHGSGKFPNNKLSLFEKKSVPFVLYGPEVLKNLTLPKSVAGAHMDITPTLIELAAPKDFQYYSIGKDLLNKNTEFLGVSRNLIISPNFMYNVSDKKQPFHPLPEVDLVYNKDEGEMLESYHNKAHGFAWWRIVNGARAN